MKLAWMGVVLLVTTTTAGADGDLTKASLDRLRTAARCEDKASPFRPWCIAADWDRGTPALPNGPLIGLSIELASDGDIRQALTDKVGFVALSVTDGKATLSAIKPTDKGEEQAVAEAVFGASAVFKGKAKTAAISKELAGYIKGIKGTYPTTRTKTSVTWTGQAASSLRKVGAFYVLIEVPASGNGIFANVLTDAWEARK